MIYVQLERNAETIIWELYVVAKLIKRNAKIIFYQAHPR